jgi:hypothetical protein
MEEFKASARAKQGMSSSCGASFLASLPYCFISSSFTILTKILISFNVLENSSEVILALVQTSSLCLRISSNLDFKV